MYLTESWTRNVLTTYDNKIRIMIFGLCGHIVILVWCQFIRNGHEKDRWWLSIIIDNPGCAPKIDICHTSPLGCPPNYLGFFRPGHSSLFSGCFMVMSHLCLRNTTDPIVMTITLVKEPYTTNSKYWVITLRAVFYDSQVNTTLTLSQWQFSGNPVCLELRPQGPVSI